MSEKRATAYHEAGHAVAYILLDRKFDYVTIVPGGGFAGHLSGGQYEGKVKRLINKEVIILLAGEVAEQICLGMDGGSFLGGGSNDMIQAEECISRAYRDYDVAMERMRELQQETWGLLMQNEKAIKAVATALMKQKTLTHAQVVATVNRSTWE